jgi:enamine deaminase RidA (YjgF/YER057c/UK114 family)
MIVKYRIFEPGSRGNFSAEWRQCLKQIIYRRETDFRLIKMNIFTDLPDYESYMKASREINTTIKSAFGEDCPVSNITIHPPEKPWKVSVEAGYADSVSYDITTINRNSGSYIVAASGSTKEVWAGGLGSGPSHKDTRSAAIAAFDQMKAILDTEGMSFNHIVRQWNYIGNILEINDGYQNYQVFNEVRSEYYQKYRTIPGYPAATGIGMNLGGVSIDFCAVMAKNNILINPVHNPDQVDAYKYGQEMLKGTASSGTSVKHPPQFERALLLSGNLRSTLFVSGTASIIGQETIGIGDVEKQTIVTIENINKLVDQKKIGPLIPNKSQEWGKFLLLRVYVKYQDDFAKVKAICREHFPEVPAIYIESDICRDNLLVELETEFLIDN